MASTEIVNSELRVPSEDELRDLAEALGFVASEVEAVKFVLDGLVSSQTGSLEEFLRSREEESPESPAPTPEVDAARAWHLHLFARDIASTAEYLADWAESIDREAHTLAFMTEDRQRSPEATREHRERRASWLERLAASSQPEKTTP